jgi:hypothetical protein
MNSRWIDIKSQDGSRFKGYRSLPRRSARSRAPDSIPGNDDQLMDFRK